MPGVIDVDPVIVLLVGGLISYSYEGSTYWIVRFFRQALHYGHANRLSLQSPDIGKPNLPLKHHHRRGSDHLPKEPVVRVNRRSDQLLARRVTS